MPLIDSILLLRWRCNESGYNNILTYVHLVRRTEICRNCVASFMSVRWRGYYCVSRKWEMNNNSHIINRMACNRDESKTGPMRYDTHHWLFLFICNDTGAGEQWTCRDRYADSKPWQKQYSWHRWINIFEHLEWVWDVVQIWLRR